MIGILGGGPYAGNGFKFGMDDAIRIERAGGVTVYDPGGKFVAKDAPKVLSMGLDLAYKSLHVRNGIDVRKGDRGAAVYLADPEMTVVHGWVIGRDGVKRKAVVFTFDRAATERAATGA